MLRATQSRHHTDSRMLIEKKKLYDTLASAEAALVRTVIKSAQVGASWADTSRKLGLVRPYCRQLRSALIELDSAESAKAIEKVRANCRELRAVFLELDRSAKIPFRCDQPSCSVLRLPRTTCWIAFLDGLTSVPGDSEIAPDEEAGLQVQTPAPALQRSAATSTPRRLPGTQRSAPSLLRQTVDLLALVLAYLFYFFVDVQLQILMLPLIITVVP